MSILVLVLLRGGRRRRVRLGIRFLLVKKLAIALVAAEDGDQEDGAAVGSKKRADGVELAGEDLEDDQGEGELGEGGAHVGAFKGALGGADFGESTVWIVCDLLGG